jgi:thiamine-monophosphate kinase
MRLSEKGELALVEALGRRFRKKVPGLVLGIGDDAAVVRPRGSNILLTTDMMVEGVHFDPAWITPFQLGFKLVSVNVSDIYAMGGKPDYLLLDFAAPGDFDVRHFESFFRGLEEASKIYRVGLVGGDISSADRVILSATVVGSADGFVTRRGARPGDRIYVTGCLGDAACGLFILKKIKRTVEVEKGRRAACGPGWAMVEPLIRKQVMPLARKPGDFLKSATAMMDISDGLFIDLSRLCKGSGTGARIYYEKIPLSDELREASAFWGMSAVDLATEGGEDYELLFTAPRDEKVDAICIGEITKRGLQIVDEKGHTRKISARGYQHFAV